MTGSGGQSHPVDRITYASSECTHVHDLNHQVGQPFTLFLCFGHLDRRMPIPWVFPSICSNRSLDVHTLGLSQGTSPQGCLPIDA